MENKFKSTDRQKLPGQRRGGWVRSTVGTFGREQQKEKNHPRAKAGNSDQGGGMQKRSKLRRRVGGAH